MQGQGRSTLAAGEEDRFLDRLTRWEKLIPAEFIRQVLQETGRVNGRACLLTHEIISWRYRNGGKRPARSNSCMARQRLEVEPMRALHQAVVRHLATPETPGAFYKGWRLMSIAEVMLDVPDSPAQSHQPSRQQTAPLAQNLSAVRRL